MSVYIKEVVLLSNLKFQKLTPTNRVDLTAYEEGFEFIFDNEDIRNIAISGPYSSGKSSLLESYKDKHPEKKFIHISLAHFSDENIKANDNQTVENSEADISLEGDESIIEGKILNQLIQQIPVENIPQSNFRIKRTSDTNNNAYRAFGIVSFISIFLLLMNYGKFCSWVKAFKFEEWKYLWLKDVLTFLTTPMGCVICVLITMSIAGVGLYYLLNVQSSKNVLKKISVQGNEIEIFEDSQNSYFDKYLNEVLYLFENSSADVIVFEDIDRFENVQIFERLREINMLTNYRMKQREDGQTIRFFYLLRDDIFITKDRVKFFDYILPVVPVLDSSNSYNKIKEFFSTSDVSNKLNDRFLKGLALYIDDLRVLKNIYNEFLIYYERLKKIDLDPNRMLAIITYKNIFPRDFADLQLNRGFVHAIFKQKDELIETEKKRFNEQIEMCKKRIQFSETELAINLEELDDIKIAKEKRIGYYSSEYRKYEKWKSEEYPIRVQAIKDRNKKDQDDLQREIEDLENEIRRIGGWSLSQIITRDNIDDIFKTVTENDLGEPTDYNEIKRSEYFDLLKFLIRYGYIDESYNDYMTYFYENSLTLSDKTFLRSVNDKRAKEYSYELNSPALVLSNLASEDFLQEEILNFNLLEYLLGEQDAVAKECLNVLAVQVEESRQYDFLIQFFATDKRRIEFVCWLNENWPRFFDSVLVTSKMNKKQLWLYSLYSVSYCTCDTLATVNESQNLSGFISKQEDFLIGKECCTDQIIEALNYLQVKFVTLDPASNPKLLEGVYENNLYVINKSNISLFFDIVYHKKFDDIKGYLSSVIFADVNQPLYSYIKENLNAFTKVAIEVSSGIITDEQSTVIEVVNSDDIDENVKLEYISLLSTVLSKLEVIKNKNCRDALLRKRLIEPSADNIYEYFSKQSITETLISFINETVTDIDFCDTDSVEDNISRFVQSILTNNAICDNHYRSIICAKGKVVTDFNDKNLDESKVLILIEEQKLQMNISNLQHLREYYPGAVISFIRANLQAYCSVVKNYNSANKEETEEIISWNTVSLDDAKRLIDITGGTFEITGHNYCEDIQVYILDHFFDKKEFVLLLKNFSIYTDKVQDKIVNLSACRLDQVTDNIKNIDFQAILQMLRSAYFTEENKVTILCSIIDNMKKEVVQESLIIAGYEEVGKLLDDGKRPRISLSENHRRLLQAFKERHYIYSYEQDKVTNTYKYSRSRKTNTRASHIL